MERIGLAGANLKQKDAEGNVVGTADTTGGLTPTEHGGDPANGLAGPCVAAGGTYDVGQAQLNGTVGIQDGREQ